LGALNLERRQPGGKSLREKMGKFAVKRGNIFRGVEKLEDQEFFGRKKHQRGERGGKERKYERKRCLIGERDKLEKNLTVRHRKSHYPGQGEEDFYPLGESAKANELC